MQYQLFYEILKVYEILSYVYNLKVGNQTSWKYSKMCMYFHFYLFWLDIISFRELSQNIFKNFS